MKNIKKFKMFLEGKENIEKIEGVLPFFPGFQNTIFGDTESQEYNMIENYNDNNSINYTYDDFDWDYKEFFKDVAKLCFNVLEPIILKLPFVEKMVYADIYNPKYYNYSNDMINVDYNINIHEMKKYFLNDSTLEDIENYNFDKDLEYKLEFLENCIKSDYTSRSGFISHYSNDITIWLKDILKNELEETQISSLIEYAILFEIDISGIDLQNEIYNSESLYNSIADEFNGLQPIMILEK
jgi:hypothetical protein